MPLFELKNTDNALLYSVWKKWNRLAARHINYPQSGNGYEALPREVMLEFNTQRLYGSRKHFCYNPFVNLFFDIYGNAIACCRSHDNILGNYPQQSIAEIWFGEAAETMRQHMLHNDLNRGCDYCKFQIASKRYGGLPSMNADRYAHTKAGKYPKILEFELSNTCNLQCVMCSGRASSSIRKNREKQPEIPSPYDDAFVEQLGEFIPHLKQAYFFGGEPFLIDIYYKIWDEILRLNPRLQVFAVSNGTIINPKVIDLLQKLDFNLIVSLDALDENLAAEIRCGSNLQLVLHNIEQYRKYSGNRVSISHTPMTINWQETPKIVDFCNSMGARLNLSYVENPARFALWSFTPEQLQEVYDYFENYRFSVKPVSINAKYNHQIFRELQSQVAFLRNKNRDILQSFSSLQHDWDELYAHFDAQFNSFMQNNSVHKEKMTQLIRVFKDVIDNLDVTPWNYFYFKTMQASLYDPKLFETEEFAQFDENPELLRELFTDDLRTRFFAQYY